MLLDNAGCNRQAQPAAVALRRLQTHKALQRGVSLVGRDARAVVDDRLGGGSSGKVTHTMEIVIGAGPKPDKAEAYDARSVDMNLRVTAG